MSNEIKNYKLILNILKEYFEGTTGDVKTETLEKCSEEIANKLNEDKDYWEHLKSQCGGKRTDGIVRGYMRTWSYEECS